MLGQGGMRVFELLGLEEGSALFEFVYSRVLDSEAVEVPKYVYTVNVFVPEDDEN